MNAILRRRFLLWLSFAGMFALAQWRVGAYHADLGGDPDEPAHAVTALMVHDYLWHGLPGSPLRFAETYYAAWPKVALGHYPPGYYVSGAIALSLWCDPAMLLICQAALVGSIGLLVFVSLLGRMGGLSALTAAVLVVLLPEMIRTGSHVMADIQVSLLMLASVLAWLQFLKLPGWRPALLFGFLAAFAILTKASAAALAGVPVITVVLCGRWQLVRNAWFWFSALPVVALAGPWMVMATKFTEEGLMSESPIDFFQDAVSYYSEAIPRVLGAAMVVLLAFVAVRDLFRFVRGGALEPWRACFWAMILATQTLMMWVPTGFSPRYLLPWWPAVVMLVVDFVMSVPLTFRGVSRPLREGAVVVLALATWVQCGPVRHKAVSGFRESVDRILSEGSSRGVWLVSSDPRGEGGVIAAAAFASPQRWKSGLRVLRGSKELSESDWLGRGYQVKFGSAKALLGRLDELGVEWVLADLSMPAEQVVRHETALNEALQAPDSGWVLSWTQSVVRAPGVTGPMAVYKRSR